MLVFMKTPSQLSKQKKRNYRAQSAMEYLMTYGWAILIIAVVISVLFALGVFNTGSSITTACVPRSGFLCSSPSLHAGILYVTLGQATGMSWTNTVYYYDPTGTSGCSYALSSGTTLVNTVWNTLTMSTTLSNTLQFIGTTTPPILPPTASAGSAYQGTIWVSYNIPTAGISNLCTQVATITLKAV
jgi:hypothetical protein